MRENKIDMWIHVTSMEVEDTMTDLDNVEVNIGMHSTGNAGHCVGPAIWTQEPWRFQHQIQPTNLLAFEFNIYAPVPGWKRGHKVYIPMELSTRMVLRIFIRKLPEFF